MNSQATDRRRAMSAFDAASKYWPNEKVGFRMLTGATIFVRMPNPRSIKPN